MQNRKKSNFFYAKVKNTRSLTWTKKNVRVISKQKQVTVGICSWHRNLVCLFLEISFINCTDFDFCFVFRDHPSDWCTVWNKDKYITNLLYILQCWLIFLYSKLVFCSCIHEKQWNKCLHRFFLLIFKAVYT